MVSNNMEHWRVSEHFFEHVENSVHDSSVTGFCGFPDTVINDIACVIDKFGVRVFTTNASEGVFNCAPWCVAVLRYKPLEKFLRFL
jgi:hypothetical protein